MRSSSLETRRSGGQRPRNSIGPAPIAIVGIGCRFPGGLDGPEEFWRFLLDGGDAIREVPSDRWNIDAHYDPDPRLSDKMYTRWGGFLDRVDHFDAQFFGISPREALHMDPQQRLLLEVAWEALEDGGQVPERLSGSSTGVFVGISTHDYSDLQVVDPRGDRDSDPLSSMYRGTGGVLSIAANRISYVFNLLGPSVAVDTACSSALVAIHLACQSIWRGECDRALAGGVNCTLAPMITVAFCKGGMLSPAGRCKPFDAGANGYVRSEGVGLLVLRPLSQALADRDPIYATIRATGSNQDGRTPGMTVPSRSSQEGLLRKVYFEAGIDPQHVGYVEAHGTGTPVGDPIEANAIGSVLGVGRPADRALVIGSVKSNIGHAESASGVAGVIKTAMMLRHKLIPRTVHFSEPNPKIDFERLHLHIAQTTEAWPEGGGQAIAGVNSFGFGGSNAHVVLEAAPPMPHRSRPNAGSGPAGAYLCPLSARGPEALVASARALLEHLAGGHQLSIEDVVHTLGARRGHHTHRLAIAARSTAELAERLGAFAAEETRLGMASGRQSAQSPAVAFVFAGMGPQWWAMGRRLMQAEPVFRAAVDECDRRLRLLAPWSLFDELMADEASSRMAEAEFAQPANFALQIGLAALWRSWGIEPAAVVGHSAGEVAAAHVAGALTLDDAVRVIYHRSRLQQQAAGKGCMLAVNLGVDEALREIEPFGNRVSLAAVNGPASITLSGDTDAVEALEAGLQERRIFARLLDVKVPYHSRHMDPLQDELLQVLADIQPRTATTPLYSSVTGQLADGEEFDGGYWWRNVREAVQFKAALDCLIERGCTTFVELSPHPALVRDVSGVLASRAQKGTVVASLRRDEADDRFAMLSSLASLYVTGCHVSWEQVNGSDAAFVRLPRYQWQRERYWHETTAATRLRLAPLGHPLMARRLDTAKPTWESELNRDRLSYVTDHRLLDMVLYPATAFLEMTLAAGREFFDCDALVADEMEIRKPLILVDRELDRGVQDLQVVLDPEEGLVNVYSRPKGATSAWTLHTVAKLRMQRGQRRLEPIDIDQIKTRCTTERSGTEWYRDFVDRGLQYGPMFQGIRDTWVGRGEVLSRIEVPHELWADANRYILHPAVLDACLQPVFTLNTNKSGVFVPVRIDSVKLHRPSADRLLWSHTRLVSESGSALELDVCVMDSSGETVMELNGARCQFLPNRRGGLPEDLDECLFECQWHAKARPGAVPRAVDYVPPMAALRGDLATTSASLAAEMDREADYTGFEVAADALSVAYVTAAFRDLGWTPAIGEQVEGGPLAARLGVVAEHRQLFERMLEILQEEDVLTSTGSGWEVIAAYGPGHMPEALYEDVLRSHPAHATDLELLRSCGVRLADVLRGQCDPLQLIFPEGSLKLAERFYQDSPTFRIYNLLAREAVSRASRDLPAGRPIRVLEIGAGTGAATWHLLPVLPSNRTEYFATDVSSIFTTFRRQKFAEQPFVRHELLDIEQPPAAQGFDLHSFDVIVATDVLHATRDLRETLSNVRSLLSPGGLLVVTEVTRVTRRVDLIFGMLSGWWRFADHDLRPKHPVMSQRQWENVLLEAGFAGIAAVSDRPPSLNPLQTVFVARGPATEIVEPRDSVMSLPEEPGSWLILADGGATGRHLAALLEAHGESPILIEPGLMYRQTGEAKYEIRPDTPQDVQALLADVQADWPACRGVVHLWALDAASPERAGLTDLDQAQTLGCVSALHVVQALASGASAATRLWLVTRGAQSVGSDREPVNVLASPLWGLGRVIASEQPKLQCTLVDLDQDGDESQIDRLFAEFWVHDSEQEIAYRGETRYVNRLTRLPAQAARLPQIRLAAGRRGRAFRLEAVKPGVLDSLNLREVSRCEPGPDEVEIETHSAAVNFRDVMKAMGLYPTLDDQDLLLGDECAGTVVRCGRDVGDLEVGDAVVALAQGAFSAYVTVPARSVVRKPVHLSFEQACSLPIVFMTSDYALNHLARLSRGERVLIHAAAGGVGLAAVQLAQVAGADVFATAGTPEKRAFLNALGVRHVMDDRSLDFAAEVMRVTGGAGVDVVLNSLAGDFIPKSLAVLGPHGRFLELGKVDIYRNNRLGLWPFRNSLSYFAIDMVSVLKRRPELADRILRDVMRRFAAGELQPIPLVSFPMTNVSGAFRFMQQARHIGKIVVNVQEGQVDVTPAEASALDFRPDATYLVTGGLGGFGLAVAEWMVGEGARHLVLAGRSGAARPEARAAIDRLEKAGATILVRRLDVADQAQVSALVQAVSDTMPPLRGIVHAAADFDDAMLMQLDAGRLARVMTPKARGAWNLHLETLDCPLDFFVMFSSVSPILGNPGQGNYAAANTFLDALAQYRRSRHLPGLAINWGPIGEVGYLTRHADVNLQLEHRGIRSLGVREATAFLGRFLKLDRSQIVAARMELERVAAYYAQMSSVSRLSCLLEHESLAHQPRGRKHGERGWIRAAVQAADPIDHPKLVEGFLREVLASVLGTAAPKLDFQQPLLDMGLDSLMAVQFETLLEVELGVRIPTAFLMAPHVAMTHVVEKIVSQLALAQMAAAPPSAVLATT